MAINFGNLAKKASDLIMDDDGNLTTLAKIGGGLVGYAAKDSDFFSPNTNSVGQDTPISNLDYNREQLPVTPRDYTQDNFGQNYFTRGEFTPAEGQGSIINPDGSGGYNGGAGGGAGAAGGDGGGNGILGTGIDGGDLLTGGLTALSLNELTNGALFDYAGKGISAVGGGLKAGANALFGGGAAPSAITNASANIANFLPANPIGAIPTAAFDMAVGGANAASGIAGVNAASQTAANLGGNIAAFGADKVAPAINYGGLSGTSGGLTSNLPAGFGSANATAGTTAAANAAASANVATGGLGTGGGTGMLSGLGALPTASQLAYLSPYFAAVPAFGMAAKYLLKPAIRGLTNFGSEEDAKREEAAKYSKESGLDDYKAMAAASMGREGATYEDYIKDQRPPDSPFKAEMDAIGDAGDRDYEEEQVVNMFQTPYGKNLMAKYYADNPKFFTPEGKRIFPESDMGDLQRASAAYNEQPIFGRDMRTGENPMSEYITNVMNKDDYGRIGGKRRFYNAGGIVGNNPNPNGYFLDGPTDGMADKVPANIGGEQPAALSDGEFVIPADIVSHLGNGSSMAGANKLDSLMQSVRMARTGNEDQGKKINANKYLNKLV